jgi:UDPglucose 6-dehydrogenase
MNICVVGTGYVGLVTGAVFADLGNDVVCVDNALKKIEALRAGQMPIYEPGLEEMVVRNKDDGRLTFSTDLSAGVRQADVIFIAVGTPPKETGETDLSQVEAVAAEIGRSMDRYKVVVNKSTVPVGTGEFVREVITRHQPRPLDFDVVSNPEFLREGSAIEDTLRPDRIVIGAPNQQVAMTLVELYAPLERPMIITDLPSAEVIKYASNSFLAAKISFINAIANICEAAGADVSQVMKGMGLDSRIGMQFLQAGLGYGGSCFPKDVKALCATGREVGARQDILETVEASNERQKRVPAEKVERALGGLAGHAVAVWGLAFKAQTDDMREAASLVVVEALLAGGASVTVHDPKAMGEGRRYFGDRVRYVEHRYDALGGADALVVLTEWQEYRVLDYDRAKALMRRPVVIDTRNLYEPARMRQHGFTYDSIGRI